MRKVKIWGGEHPDELAALACVDSLETDPIPNVSPGIANPLARHLGKRLVDVNLVNVYPGDPASPKYEERRAVEVLRESEGFDVVASLHNFGQFGENTAWVDEQKGVSPLVLGFLGALGLRKILLTSYGGIQRYANNGVMLETDPNGLCRDVEKLRVAFASLANDPNPPHAGVEDFEWFMLVNGSVHVRHWDPTRFSARERERLHNFEPLPDDVMARLGLEGAAAYMTAWRYAPNEQGYWGEAAIPIAVPDSSSWPK